MPTGQPDRPAARSGPASEWMNSDQAAYADAARQTTPATGEPRESYPRRRLQWRRARARRLRVG